MKTWALMYHRVVPRRPDTAPYFARGTAVEPETFARQLDWLMARHRVGRPCDGQPGGVLLTFDDGYRDVVDHVWPLCRARGLRFAVYPAADHLADAPAALWFDDYYDRVARGRWSDADVARCVARALDRPESDSPADPDLRWWVRGPVKQRLAGGWRHRAHLLDRLGAALGVARDPTLAARLYLDHAALESLSDAGVEIGGHGRTHLRHAGLPDGMLGDEITAASALLDRLGVCHPRSYCYPDGSVDERSAAAVARSFARGFTVRPGAFEEPASDAMRLPRFIVRDRPPDDPMWCAASADPDFTRLP